MSASDDRNARLTERARIRDRNKALTERARIRAIVTPASLDELRRLWTLRDHFYAKAKRPLTAEQEEVIRTGRLREAVKMPAVMREIAIREAAAWHPPRVMAK